MSHPLGDDDDFAGGEGDDAEGKEEADGEDENAEGDALRPPPGRPAAGQYNQL